jgi:hypothetical protein
MDLFERDSQRRNDSIKFGRELDPIVFEREKETRLRESDTSIEFNTKIDTFIQPEGGGGGGFPSGFNEEILDVVNDDNTAGQRVFLTKEVT